MSLSLARPTVAEPAGAAGDACRDLDLTILVAPAGAAPIAVRSLGGGAPDAGSTTVISVCAGAD